MAADPQNYANGPKDENDDRCDEQRALADTSYGRRECRLDASREVPTIDRLVAVTLHGPNLVQRLVEERTDIADTVLRRAREPPHSTTEENDRNHDDRHAGE